MTQAARWLSIATTLPAPGKPIAADALARGLLTQAAESADPAGITGWLWRFADGSRIVAHQIGAFVLEGLKA